MKIVVFTSKGCMHCEDLKDFLNSVGLAFSEMDAQEVLDPKTKDYFTKYPDWRTSGAVDAVALLAWNGNELPVTVIDGQAYTSQEVLAKFAHLRPATAPKAPVMVTSTWRPEPSVVSETGALCPVS